MSDQTSVWTEAASKYRMLRSLQDKEKRDKGDGSFEVKRQALSATMTRLNITRDDLRRTADELHEFILSDEGRSGLSLLAASKESVILSADIDIEGYVHIHLLGADGLQTATIYQQHRLIDSEMANLVRRSRTTMFASINAIAAIENFVIMEGFHPSAVLSRIKARLNDIAKKTESFDPEIRRLNSKYMCGND